MRKICVDNVKAALWTIALGSIVLFAHSVQAWDYDSGWLNTRTTSGQSICYGHTNYYGVGGHCGITAGRDPRQYYFASTAYFSSDIYTDLPFPKGECRVSFTVVYTAGESDEDFIAIINSRSGIVYDPTSYNSVRVVMLPGTYTFYKGWNRIYVFPYTNQIDKWWAQSVWFGRYTGTSYDFRDFEARGENGRNAVRIQCNNANPTPPLSATLSATPTSGTATLTTHLTASASGGNGNTKYYRFRCKNFTSFSSWRANRTYTCQYPTVGAYDATVEVRQSGSATVRATRRITVTTPQRPLSVSLRATPSSGYATLVSWLEATTTGGNSNVREYRYRCKSFTGFSSWRRYNRYSCRYPNPGTYTAAVEVRQSGSTTVTATTPITVIGPLTTTLSAQPATGGAPLTTTVTAHPSGGNSNVKYYRFKCTSTGSYSPWRINAPTYSCSYPRAGTQTATVQVWQSGMSSAFGSTNITVTARCGNAIVEAGEQCDDGNTRNNDGCSSTCQNEVAACPDGIIQAWAGEQCDDNNRDYTDACTNCRTARCGDGYVHSGVEQCDDGNRSSGDGCNSNCQVESVTGSCGSAQDAATCSRPSINLCASGSATMPTYDVTGRTWRWYCGSNECTTRKRCTFNETAP